MEIGQFYIYRHLRKDSNGKEWPFYVGKGKFTTKRHTPYYRAYCKESHNIYWHKIVNKNGYNVEIIMENLTEKEALQKEIEFIKLYKSLGYCEANLTNGGEGVSGYKCSLQTAKKISQANKGRTPWNKGKTGVYSEETKKRISTTLKNSIESCKIIPHMRGKKGVASPMKGKTHSEETRKKLSEALKGRSVWNKGKTGIYTADALKKMSDGHRGRKLPEETKRKMSEARKDYLKRKKEGKI